MSESSSTPGPQPLAQAERDATPTNVSTKGPLKPTKPELEGKEDFLCPECAAPLAINTHHSGLISTVKRLDCFHCRQAWWPKDLVSVPSDPRRADAIRQGQPFFDKPPKRD